MSSNECNVTSDCLDVIDDGVVRFCFETAAFSDEVFFCDCTVFYGWQGEFCDEETGVLIYNRFSITLLLLLSIFVVLLAGRTVILNLMVSFNPTHGVDPILFTGVFVLLSALSLSLNLFLRVRAFYDPTFFDVEVYNTLFFGEVENAGTRYGVAANFFLILTSAFQTVASLSMMLSWENVIVKVSRFQSPEQVANEQKWKNRLKIFAVIYVLGLILLLGLRLFFGSAIVIAIVSLIASIFFIFYATKFVKTLVLLYASENEIAVLTMKLVRKVCIICSICLVIITMASFGYYVSLINIDESLRPGQFNYALFIRDIGFMAAIVFLTTASWYVNSVTEGAILADDYRTCCWVFKLWDKKNTELMPEEQVIYAKKALSARQEIVTADVNSIKLNTALLEKSERPESDAVLSYL